MADENPSWGYGRVYGELKNLGYDVHWQTVRRVMREHGLLDDPGRPEKTSWRTFLRSHWESIAATDFFTVEAWTKTGLTRFLVLFVIDLSTRRVKIAGIHHDPAEPQMIQWARQLTDAEDGFLNGKRVLIHDRDPLFTKKFRRTLSAAGVRCLKMPKQEEVPPHPQRRRRAVPQDAEAVAEPERLRRVVGADDQAGVPQQTHPLRRAPRPTRDRAVRRALQPGAPALGHRAPPAAGAGEAAAARRPRRVPRTAGRLAQELLPQSRLRPDETCRGNQDAVVVGLDPLSRPSRLAPSGLSTCPFGAGRPACRGCAPP